MLDEGGFLGRLAAPDVLAVRAYWHAQWRTAVPGSDRERAARLLAPVGVARGAVEDPLRCLRAAAAVLEGLSFV
jgi:hypothetical protein